MIVATVGHVDHGKTALVKALTGVDTDRLPQEKARGLSIDLGFAWRRGSAGRWMGFVDVPGHERFIRNMLAGVCGIDLALVVVAADDGVMPQTREHLAILHLLGLARGAVVVTKADRVPAQRVEQVLADVGRLLDGTPLAGAPGFRTAPTRGDGVPALLRFLDAQLLLAPVAAGARGPFRLAIDRAFTLPGSGTVVTGTVFDGQVSAGDMLVVSPAGRPVRVRRVRVRDEEVGHAARGERCALNLVGIEVGQVARGHWVLCETLHRPTRCLDAKLNLLPDAGRVLQGRQPVQLHLATASTPARAAPTAPGLAPGASGFVRLSLDAPIGALHGDRFIVRDPSTHRTLGGGVVIDPFASRERSTPAARTARLRALDQAAPQQVLRDLALAPPGFVDLDAFRAAFKLDAQDVPDLVERAGLVRLGGAGEVAMSRDRLDELRGNIVAMLAGAGDAHPAGAGSEVERLAHAAAPRLPRGAFQAVVDGLVRERAVRLEGGRLRLAAHDAAAAAADEALWRRVHPKLGRRGFDLPRAGELAHRLGVEPQVLQRLLHRKVSQGELLKIGADRYLPRPMVSRLAGIASRVANAQPERRFSAAQFRDALGTGRALAIGLLDCLDRQCITVRTGDLRRMSGRAAGLLGVSPGAARGRRQNWRHRHRFGPGAARK